MTTIRGTFLNDILEGTEDGDIIEGLAGNDEINGNGGNDNIDAGAGDDTVNGGDGNDIINGGSGDDTVFGGAGNDEISDFAGINTLNGGEGNDHFEVGADPALSERSFHTISGGTGDDTVAATSIISLLSLSFDGGEGNDRATAWSLGGVNNVFTFDMGTGDDIVTLGVNPADMNMDGLYNITLGEGVDRVVINWVPVELVTITDFNPLIGEVLELQFLPLLSGFNGTNPFDIGGIARMVQVGDNTELRFDVNETGNFITAIILENVNFQDLTAANLLGFTPGNQSFFEGTSDSDVLIGTEGNDDINGFEGDDRLTGGLGNDTLIGGDGDDTVVFTGNFSDYSFSQATNGSIIVTDNTELEGTDTLFEVEFLEFADQTVSSTSLFGITVAGTGASDVLDGTERADELSGLAGDDTLNGLAGDDVLIGGAGADLLNGGVGTDTADYSGSSAGVVVFTDGRGSRNGDAEGDVLDSVENFIGSDFNDTFRLDSGSADVNIVNAGAGNDRIRAQFDGSDGDQYFGEAGDDNIFGGSGDETLDGGDGEDNLFGNQGDDILDGGAGRDGLFGGGGNDTINAGDGNDALRGNSGNDALFGGEGRDNIQGGSGADMLFGEAGNDVLDGGNGSGDVLDGGAGNDRLTGGIGNDTFVFADGYDTDRITDFNNGNGDVVDISDFGIADFAALQALMVQTANDVRIDFGDGDVLIFTGLTLTDLDANDFIF